MGPTPGAFIETSPAVISAAAVFRRGCKAEAGKLGDTDLTESNGIEERRKRYAAALALPTMSVRQSHVGKLAVLRVRAEGVRMPARVAVNRGRLLQTMGQTSGSKLNLEAEEAVFLAERMSGVMVDQTETVLSIQEAFTMLDGTNGVSVEEYALYAHLKRNGFIVRRHGESFKEGVELPAEADTWERKSTEKKRIAKKTEKKRKRKGPGEESHDEMNNSAGSRWMKMADREDNDLITKYLPPIAANLSPKQTDDDDDGGAQRDACGTTEAMDVEENDTTEERAAKKKRKTDTTIGGETEKYDASTNVIQMDAATTDAVAHENGDCNGNGVSHKADDDAVDDDTDMKSAAQMHVQDAVVREAAMKSEALNANGDAACIGTSASVPEVPRRSWYPSLRKVDWLALSLVSKRSLSKIKACVSDMRLRTLCWSNVLPRVRQLKSSTGAIATAPFLNSGHQVAEPTPAEEHSDAIPCFDVYEPQKNFRRAQPGLPIFRVILAKAGGAERPDSAYLIKATRIGADGVPSRIARVDGHQLVMYVVK